ncbi:hypothetical protein M885DRAFT_490112 [Pelagophyceae sp. CCMP2097]|nr:hypothetical protein M885DRAFT_490112 [Pelagophyceae sp. CCMP2097]
MPKRRAGQSGGGSGGAPAAAAAGPAPAAAGPALGGGVRALSGYFPRASVVKTGGGAALVGADSVSILLFYQYVEPLWTEAKQQLAVDHCVEQGAALLLGGRIRVAREGFNVTVSGSFESVRAFATGLRVFDAKAFASTEFKFVDGEPLAKHFPDLKIFPVVELVHYGLDPKRAPPLSTGAQHLDAAAFHAKLLQAGTVVVDVRNHYETDIGRFTAPSGGAEYLDPQMRVSTEFPAWAAANEAKLQGKQVLMYCTGGIRCERASGLVRQLSPDLDVFQLQGGIEKYLQAYPDGGLWTGKNFTFDKRGDLAASTTAQAAAHKAAVLARCCACGKPWDTYLGKRKCAANVAKTGQACGVPVLVCEDCLTARVSAESLRCPLCAPAKHYAPPPAAKGKAKKRKPARDGVEDAAAEAGAKKHKKRKTDGAAPPAGADAAAAPADAAPVDAAAAAAARKKKNKKKKNKARGEKKRAAVELGAAV